MTSARTVARRGTAERARGPIARQPAKHNAEASNAPNLDMCGCMSFWARLLIWATRNNDREQKIHHRGRLSRMMHRDRQERHHV